MSVFEAEAILNQHFKTYKDAWEQTRFLAYIQALTAGNKLKSPQDLIKFTWDKETVKEEVSTKDFEARKQAMLDFISGSKSTKEFNPNLS
jgi:hypothetical protein